MAPITRRRVLQGTTDLFQTSIASTSSVAASIPPLKTVAARKVREQGKIDFAQRKAGAEATEKTDVTIPSSKTARSSESVPEETKRQSIAKPVGPTKKGSNSVAKSQSQTAGRTNERKRSLSETAEKPSKVKRTSSSSKKYLRPTPAPPRQTNEDLPPESLLIPGVLTFSFEEARDYIIKTDPRFERVFTKLKCRPFQDLEPVDAFRALCTSIIGQQVSWLAARAINYKFRRLFDPNLPEKPEEKGSEGWGASKTAFPTPNQIMKADVMFLKSAGLSTRKAEYVQSLAEHFADGRLSGEFLQTAPVEEVSKALIDVRGIGQWTVDMFLIFTLRRPDIMPVGEANPRVRLPAAALNYACYGPGDLGVQKGLLRWIISAYANETLPAPPEQGSGLGDPPTTPPPDHSSIMPVTPVNVPSAAVVFPPTPSTPSSQPISATIKAQEQEVEASLHLCPRGFKPEVAYPLPEGLSVEILKSRLSGKKVKGGQYLTPQEMYDLTDHWRPYRSLGVYYMWAVAEETS